MKIKNPDYKYFNIILGNREFRDSAYEIIENPESAGFDREISNFLVSLDLEVDYLLLTRNSDEELLRKSGYKSEGYPVKGYMQLIDAITNKFKVKHSRDYDYIINEIGDYPFLYYLDHAGEEGLIISSNSINKLLK